MNAGGTMMRVYDALKGGILAGGFRPGERLDPARLSEALTASATPIRDALNRLTGEGLVESLQHDGYRLPQVNESVLRERYEWSAELLVLVLRTALRRGLTPTAMPVLPSHYPDAVAACFHGIAQLSPNHEHRLAISALIDRSALVRLVEVELLPHALEDVRQLTRAICVVDAVDIRRSIDRFHRSRLRMVPELASRLRDYPFDDH
jgi:DNA-binding GntR family transcriptional regulator